MTDWYVMHTKPHRERSVAAQLRETRGVEVYLPLVRVNATQTRTPRDEPYFSNYLFINADLERIGLSAIQWVPGTRHLVSLGGCPAIVPEEFIYKLRQRLREIRAGGGIRIHELVAGDDVRVVAGPVEGYEGIFGARLSGSERVQILLEMLAQSGAGAGRAVKVELYAGDIVKVKSRRRRGRRRH